MTDLKPCPFCEGHYGMLPESEIVWKVSEEDEEA